VALFTNGTYVDYDTANTRSEASQLEYTLKSFGLTVVPVNAIDSAAIATALTGTGVFIMPEEEVLAVASVLTAGAKTAIRRFVDSTGGTLIIVPDGAGIELLDTLFNYAILSGSFENFTTLNGTAAAGTPFAGGPARIWENNGTYEFDQTSLPAGGVAVYTGTAGGATVGFIPQGRGMVVLISWDWFQAAPHGPQDGGWLEVLRRALRF
jgi:hypothetical protein